MNRIEDIEREEFIKEVMEIINSKKEFREQLTRVMDKYIIFKRSRCHESIE